MKFLFVTTVLALAVPQLAFSLNCAHGEREEVVGEHRSNHIINYTTGDSENIVVKYRGIASMNVSQTGSSSSWNSPIDTRRCHWSTEAKIIRELCVNSRSLGEQCQGAHTQIFYISSVGRGDSFNPFRSQIQGENCNRACAAFNQDFNSTKSAVNRELSQVVESDLMPFLTNLRQDTQIGEIVDQN